MKKEYNLEISKKIFIIPAMFVVLIWVIYWIEINFGFNFNRFGVYPRTFKGFRGVFITHFIHGSAPHLFNNSIPLFVLLSSLFYFYRESAMKVLFLGAFFTGFLTWLIGRESYHIGASGVVYVLFSFVFFSGIIRKHYRLVALSLIIIFLYGSMIWYVLPIKDEMSWEGHLSGFTVGLSLAFFFRNNGIVKEEYQFSQTEFDLMFDSDGNFVPAEIEVNIDKEME